MYIVKMADTNLVGKRPHTEMDPNSSANRSLRKILDEVLEETFDEKLKKVNDIDHVEFIQTEFVHVEKVNKTLKKRLVSIDMQSRSDNFLIHGIPAQRREGIPSTVLQLVARGGIQQGDRAIVHCHRLGRFMNAGTRSVIIR